MEYLNVKVNHEFSCILCGHFESENFVHMERNIGIHVLIIVEQGILNIDIAGVKYKVKAGEMILLPANRSHRGYRDSDTSGSIKYFWAHFVILNEHMYSPVKEDNFALPIYFTLNNRDRVRILSNQLLDVSLTTGIRQRYCDFLFTALCYEIASQFENDNITENLTVNKAVSYINININKKITLQDVAEKIGYSKQYLSRVFKEYMKMSVNNYIIKKKLEFAKYMLTASDESVSAIADMIGFDDTGYFMRVFKKSEGMTCLKYKNAYSKMYINDK